MTKGQDIVDQISQGDLIESITIKRHGKYAQKWDSSRAFEDFNTGSKFKYELNKEKNNILKSLVNGMKKTKSGLYFSILKEGQGAKPVRGSSVSVHYKGMFVDGTIFDSSYQRNQPIEFLLGTGQVIKGWDEGLMLLNKGSIARFVIPSHLAYGSHGAGETIPPDTTLVFDVELVNF